CARRVALDLLPRTVERHPDSAVLLGEKPTLRELRTAVGPTVAKVATGDWSRLPRMGKARRHHREMSLNSSGISFGHGVFVVAGWLPIPPPAIALIHR